MASKKQKKKENGSICKITALRRKGGAWKPLEVSLLSKFLETQISQNPDYPEYLLMRGHHTDQATLKIVGKILPHTSSHFMGADSPRLPFHPGFA
ncbi:hypothetical protein A2442_00300 [Candidatus Campbellbacteria bacterium RIFOXYC2_FULL_35_25]|uniref:Uncharacterized protein n=1 Tax=Candidatus Campbellbacteria bacterium RIFOXYC2_FULL_35_25 TaxID=1797582 RepID=A0A1F5EI68_9BACT|nr:MAG: hypothetical protein A2442_00300 [Candidatus Campbellbacteria bacterium RIFOXYC2_FULL_35_25]